MGNSTHALTGEMDAHSSSVRTEALRSYVILRRRGWPSTDALARSAKRSLEVAAVMGDVRWVRSYVLSEPDGWVGTVCHYRASSEDAIREHARRVKIPIDDVIEVSDLIVLLPDSLDDLTSREREVLALLGEGMRNREIAEKLVLSVRTVDHHVSAIMRKLRTSTRGAAVVEARRRGLLATR